MMIKSIVVIVVATLFVALAEVNERQNCVNQVAEFLAELDFKDPVWQLVAESRIFYTNATVLIEEDITSDEYEKALKNVGTKEGCEELKESVLSLEEVDCYKNLLKDDERHLLDIIEQNNKAGVTLEAYFACREAKGDESTR